ncbi:hypothetical protein QEN19_002389 [Hanseniaspora menglaensis]
MDPPSNSGILTRASRRNRRSTITGLANTPLGKSRRETLIGEKAITNSSDQNNMALDFGSVSKTAPSLNNNSTENEAGGEKLQETNNQIHGNNVDLGKENVFVEQYLNKSPNKIDSMGQKLDTIESSNENTGTIKSKRSIHQEFQLDNIMSTNKRRKGNDSGFSDAQEASKQKNKIYLSNQSNHSHYKDLPMLGDLEDDDDDNNGLTNSDFHSAIKNRVLDRFLDNNNANSFNTNKNNYQDGIHQIPKESGQLRNRDVEVSELKRSNELLTIKIATYLEDFKKIDTNGTMEEQFNKLVKWKHNYQKISHELGNWKIKCQDVEQELKSIKENPSTANKEIFGKLESEISNLREENKKLQDSVFDVSRERNEFKDECDAIRYQKDTLEREKNAIALNLTSAENKLSVLDSDLIGKTNKVQELDAEITVLKGNLDLFKKRYDQALMEITTLKASSIEKTKLTNDLQLKNDEIGNFEKKIKELNNSLKLLENDKLQDQQKFKMNLEKLNYDLDEYKNLFNEKSNELKKFVIKYAELEVESEFKINKLTKELDAERSKNDGDEEYLSKMKIQIRNLNNELIGLQNEQLEKEKLSFKCSELENVVESKDRNLKILEDEKRKLANDIFELKDQVDNLKKENVRKQRTETPLFVEHSNYDAAELKQVKLENEQLQNKVLKLNHKLKSQDSQYADESNALREKIAVTNAKLNENMKEYLRLEDELIEVREAKDILNSKLQKIDQYSGQKMERLIDENNALKLDLAKFSKTALKYQNENSLLKDDLFALETNFKKYKKSKNTMDENIELLKVQNEQEIRSIKKQYIQEIRNLQEENLQLTENLTMFKNSVSSKSRLYSGKSNNSDRDVIINNLQDQLQFFKNKYNQEVNKNKDLQTMNEHYRKLVNQSTNDLRMGRLQKVNSNDRKFSRDDHLYFFNDKTAKSSADRFRYTSSDFNI